MPAGGARRAGIAPLLESARPRAPAAATAAEARLATHSIGTILAIMYTIFSWRWLSTVYEVKSSTSKYSRFSRWALASVTGIAVSAVAIGTSYSSLQAVLGNVALSRFTSWTFDFIIAVTSFVLLLSLCLLVISALEALTAAFRSDANQRPK